MKVRFIVTNPNHHLLIVLPIAIQLAKKGADVKLISLCEIRKFKTPHQLFKDLNLEYLYFDIKVPGANIKKVGRPKKKKATRFEKIKSSAQRFVFWHLVIRRKMGKWLKESDAAVLLNDTAYPGNYIVKLARRKKCKTYLLQEGIRFPLPVETQHKYGDSGVDYLISWGKNSADFFKTVVRKNTKVLPLGSPGFDKSIYIQKSMGSDSADVKTIAIFGNPIDDQKFVTHTEKIAIYIDLARQINRYATQNNLKIEVIFKNHPRESPEYLRDVLEKNNLGNIRVYESASDIDIVINEVDAGIVFASTVGINVIVHGKKLAVVKLKNHGYLGDYVQQNVGYKLNVYHPEFEEQLGDFLSDEHHYLDNYKSYLDDFAANAGKSHFAIADHIISDV